jgi:hypothetical protein
MANDRWGCGNPSAWMVFDIFMWGNIPKTKRAVARGGARSGQTGQMPPDIAVAGTVIWLTLSTNIKCG